MKLIPLTRGMSAIVDDEDFEQISSFRWCFDGGYARRKRMDDSGKWVNVFMCKTIVNPPTGMCADHINGNTLDNRRSNLRPATRLQNNRNSKIPKNNTSGHKGVTWHNRHRKWGAHIRVSGRLIHLGYFDNPKDAGAVYSVSAKQHFGEFARC